MKKLILLFAGLLIYSALQAQWVNNPAQNTFIANTSADAGEIYLATDPVSGDTYVQWSQFASNGWVPKVQHLNFAGEPQWDADGLQPSAQYTLATWSQGFAMAATTDNALVSCFSTEAGNSIAVKINADGTFAWGEQGIVLFNGAGGSRTELLAGEDGGVWAMSTDLCNTYLCYIYADGVPGPTITITDNNGKICTFGLMVPAPNGNVFVVYEKEEWAYTYFYEKDLHVVGYSKNGIQISDDIQLMAPVTIAGSYCHYVVPDGLGGGYVYIWHPAGMSGTFNTYVFHFDQNGVSTITDLNGIPVHSNDPYNFYLDAYATVDPVSHDLLIVYEQTDEQFQQESRVYVNRINTIGDRLWNEGIVVVEENGNNHSDLIIDAFEYGGGYCIVYDEGDGYYGSIKAVGINDSGNQIWNTTMCSQTYPKTVCKNSTGFHGGQNIIAWVNSTGSTSGGGPGGLYGQNIGQNGEMGEVIPPTPPTPCYPPTNFQCEYVFDTNTQQFGAQTSWDAPRGLPIKYNLYRQDLNTQATVIIEVAPDVFSYFDATGIGDFKYQLTAVYENGESDFALTPSGENYVFIEVTSVPESQDEAIVSVLKIYSMNGQLIKNTNLEALSNGLYILQGLTQSGKLVNQKIIIQNF